MSKPLTVAVQMDPMDQINIAGDSSFALMLSAQRAGTGCSITMRATSTGRTAIFGPARIPSRCSASRATITASAIR